MHCSSGVLSLIMLSLLTLTINPATAQSNDTRPDGYPDWVTNDYQCVIGCLQGFNGGMKERPNPALEKTSLDCVSNTCSKDTTGLNVYQAQYIIQMYYSTGSIYECDGKPCNFTATTQAQEDQSPQSQFQSQSQSSSPDGNSTNQSQVSSIASLSIPPLNNASYSASKPAAMTEGANPNPNTTKNGTTSAGFETGGVNLHLAIAWCWTIMLGLVGVAVNGW